MVHSHPEGNPLREHPHAVAQTLKPILDTLLIIPAQAISILSWAKCLPQIVLILQTNQMEPIRKNKHRMLGVIIHEVGQNYFK